MMRKLLVGSIFMAMGVAEAKALAFRDAETGPGHPRNAIVMIAEARDCGASASRRLPLPLMPRFTACMLARGWVSRATEGRPIPPEGWTSYAPLGASWRGVHMPW